MSAAFEIEAATRILHFKTREDTRLDNSRYEWINNLRRLPCAVFVKDEYIVAELGRIKELLMMISESDAVWHRGRSQSWSL